MSPPGRRIEYLLCPPTSLPKPLSACPCFGGVMLGVVFDTLAIINTVDTILGLLFLATSYVVWRRRGR